MFFMKKKKKSVAPVNIDPAVYDYWAAVKPGSFLTIADKLAIMEGMSKGLGTDSSVTYQIKNIFTVVEDTKLVTWHLFELVNNEDDDELYFMVKKVDQDFDLRLYFVIPDLVPGSREDFLENGMDWIFADSDLEVNKMNFTKIITQTTNEGEEINFIRKTQGELYGQGTSTENAKKYLSTIVEYSTDQDRENPEMLILETGLAGSDSSFIQVMAGTPVNPSEVLVY